MAILAATEPRTRQPGTMTEADKDDRLRWWADCLAGRATPPPIRVTPEFEALIADLEREKKVKFVEEAKWMLRRVEAFARDHPGQRVIWLETPAGPAILAAGEAEVALFHKHYLDDLSRNAQLDYPAPDY